MRGLAHVEAVSILVREVVRVLSEAMRGLVEAVSSLLERL